MYIYITLTDTDCPEAVEKELNSIFNPERGIEVCDVVTMATDGVLHPETAKKKTYLMQK